MADTALINPLDEWLGYRLRRVSTRLIQRLATSLEAIGLRLTEASVLILIEANPLITQSEVGRVLDIQRANMAPLAARLEQQGLIGRARADGRSVGLRVTAKGASVAAQAVAIMRSHEALIARELPPHASATLMEALDALWQLPGTAQH